ncbi:MAG: hypothetical protein V3U71_01405 [Cocleimonas sp.]
MINLQKRIVSILVIVTLSTVLSSCSGFNKIGSFLSDKKTVNYQKNNSVKNLEFPPDLTAPEFDKEFVLPEASAMNTVSLRSSGVVSTNSVGNFPPDNTSSVSPSAATQGQRTGTLSSVKTFSGKTVLHIHDSYPRALVLTEIMLERLRFSIVSSNARNGTYQVKYNGEDLQKEKKKGFLSGTLDYFKGLTADSDYEILSKGKVYQVQVVNNNGAPLLSFNSSRGETLPSHAQIITIFNNEFNR